MNQLALIKVLLMQKNGENELETPTYSGASQHEKQPEWQT